jgi:hypothetical protein
VSISLSQFTQEPHLRFYALLGNGAKDVRFERVVENTDGTREVRFERVVAG